MLTPSQFRESIVKILGGQESGVVRESDGLGVKKVAQIAGMTKDKFCEKINAMSDDQYQMFLTKIDKGGFDMLASSTDPQASDLAGLDGQPPSDPAPAAPGAPAPAAAPAAPAASPASKLANL